jgi:hypothetical protein
MIRSCRECCNKKIAERRMYYRVRRNIVNRRVREEMKKLETDKTSKKSIVDLINPPQK